MLSYGLEVSGTSYISVTKPPLGFLPPPPPSLPPPLSPPPPHHLFFFILLHYHLLTLRCAYCLFICVLWNIDIGLVGSVEHPAEVMGNTMLPAMKLLTLDKFPYTDKVQGALSPSAVKSAPNTAEASHLQAWDDMDGAREIGMGAARVVTVAMPDRLGETGRQRDCQRLQARGD